MKYVKLYCCLFLLFLSFSCIRKTDNMENDVPIYKIDYLSWEKKSLVDFFNEKKVNYILLKDNDHKAPFGRIDKIKIMNERIYISDKRLQVLAVYDINGRFLTTIGRRGQGPFEYLSITDFDVDLQGKICILDGRLDKALFYNSDFQFDKEKKLQFEADIIQFLDDEKLILGLSSWNHGLNKGDKIVVTDLNLNVIESYYEYDKYVDPTFWISDYQFAKSENCIAYNQTISNYIYIFTHEGELSKSICIDFLGENVPDKVKMNIEHNLNDFDNYCMLKKIVAVTDEYIIGTLWEHRNTRMFIADMKKYIFYLGSTVNDMDRNFLCGFCKEGVISNIIEKSENYPDSVNNHLEIEGSVLKIQSIDL